MADMCGNTPVLAPKEFSKCSILRTIMLIDGRQSMHAKCCAQSCTDMTKIHAKKVDIQNNITAQQRHARRWYSPHPRLQQPQSGAAELTGDTTVS